MLGCAKTESDQVTAGVDDVADKDTAGYDFSVWTFFFVQIPCTSNTKEIACVTRPVHDQNDQV